MRGGIDYSMLQESNQIISCSMFHSSWYIFRSCYQTAGFSAPTTYPFLWLIWLSFYEIPWQRRIQDSVKHLWSSLLQLAVNYFCKKFHHNFFSESLMRFCICHLLSRHLTPLLFSWFSRLSHPYFWEGRKNLIRNLTYDMAQNVSSILSVLYRL